MRQSLRGKFHVAALLALILTACAGPRFEWFKEGADDEQRRADFRACEREAERYDFMAPPSANPTFDDARGGTAGPMRGEIFSGCLRGLGYERRRAEEAQ